MWLEVLRDLRLGRRGRNEDGLEIRELWTMCYAVTGISP